MKADDDTYVVVENLRRFLAHLDPNEPLYIGCKMSMYIAQGYMSGGAGYVLSKEALRRFVERGLYVKKAGEKDPCGTAGSAEDLQFGRCMEWLKIKPIQAKDSKGKMLFYPMYPAFFYNEALKRANPKFWLFKYVPEFNNIVRERESKDFVDLNRFRKIPPLCSRAAIAARARPSPTTTSNPTTCIPSTSWST